MKNTMKQVVDKIPESSQDCPYFYKGKCFGFGHDYIIMCSKYDKEGHFKASGAGPECSALIEFEEIFKRTMAANAPVVNKDRLEGEIYANF